jgi:hypothetical protein
MIVEKPAIRNSKNLPRASCVGNLLKNLVSSTQERADSGVSQAVSVKIKRERLMELVL